MFNPRLRSNWEIECKMTKQNEQEVEETAVAVIEVEGEAYIGQPINEEVVSSFGQTLMRMHPQGQEIGARGMYTIAQLALVTGANPLPGSNGIHAWVDKKGKLNITFGIDFWRGEGEKEGGLLWVDHPRPMTSKEREHYGILEAQDAAICSACLKRDAIDLLREMQGMGLAMTLKDAMDIVKRTGFGVANAQEYAKAGRSRQWSADKRAETDLYRKLVPTMRRANERIQKGEYVESGKDWSLVNYADEHRPELQAPESYSAEDANDDLIDYDDPDTRPKKDEEFNEGLFEEVVDTETGEIIDDPKEVAQEVEAEEIEEQDEENVEQHESQDDSGAEKLQEVQELAEELGAEIVEDDVLPDDEQNIYETNGVPDFVALIKAYLSHYKEGHPHIHQAMIKMGHVNGLNDLPVITHRDKIEENIKEKRLKRLGIYRIFKARDAEVRSE